MNRSTPVAEDFTSLSLDELAQISGGGEHQYGAGHKAYRPWQKPVFKPGGNRPYRPNYPRPGKKGN